MGGGGTTDFKSLKQLSHSVTLLKICFKCIQSIDYFNLCYKSVMYK